MERHALWPTRLGLGSGGAIANRLLLVSGSLMPTHFVGIKTIAATFLSGGKRERVHYPAVVS